MGSATPSFRHAVALSLAQKYLAFVLQLAVAMILARLLTPAETGIFSLAAAAVALGHLLREFGMSDYIVSQKDMPRDKLRAAFTVTVLLAWGIALIMWIVASPMARLYNEPGLKDVIRVLSLSFLLLPFGTTAAAMLSREMQFQKMFAIQTAVLIIGAATTVGCAWFGLSYMSLAIGTVAGNLASILLLLMVSPRGVFLRPTTSGLREAIGFGGSLTAARAMDQIASRSSDFIVSGVLGFHALGLLSKASTLSASFHEFFNSAVLRVATPVFAKAQNAAADTRDPYIRATGIVASALWVFFPVLGVYAHEIIFILFGPNWLECVPLIQIMSAASMVWAPYMLSTSLLTARGAVSVQLRIQMVAAPVMLLALLAGAFHSLLAVVVMGAVAGWFKLYLIERAMKSVCGISVSDVLSALWPTAGMALAATTAGVAVKWLLTTQAVSPLITLPLGVTTMLSVAAVAAWQLKLPVAAEVARAWQARRALRRTSPSGR